MNAQLRKLGAGLVACYVALFVMVNYVQVVKAPELNDNPLNSRAIVRDFDRPRGQIVTADGVVIARTEAAAPESRFEFQRVYPEGDLYGHVTGFLNFDFQAEGVERFYNDYLSGQASELEYQSLSDLFVDRERVGDVTLTILDSAQRAARDALGQQRGSVVAVDPRDGSILAMWSFPSFDPNLLSVHDQATAQANRDALEPGSQTSPLIPAMYRQRFFPGSTFKVVTGSIGVDNGVVTPENPNFPTLSEFDVDFTEDELSNFGGGSCGGRLFDILRVSCNTAFATMGADTIGEDRMIAGAERFGFNERPPLDLPSPASSAFPTDFPDNEGNGPVARASIGQGNVAATPLHMALIAGGIANGGVIMAPHVLDEITDETGEVVEESERDLWRQAIGPDAAGVMRQAMLGVVTNGTATRLAIPGVEVGGKTGTAQLGSDPPSSHAWIIGFAGPPGGQATVAVAVLVQAQPGVSEVTGGRVAAPIARAVLEAVLAAQAGS